MRILGTVLLILGAFFLAAAMLAVLGPSLRAEGMNVFGTVTSIPGAFAVGAVLVLAGIWLRRRRPR